MTHFDNLLSDYSERLNEFKKYWKEQNSKNPELFPLELSPGDFDEQLEIFLSNKSNKEETFSSLVIYALSSDIEPSSDHIEINFNDIKLFLRIERHEVHYDEALNIASPRNGEMVLNTIPADLKLTRED